MRVWRVGCIPTTSTEHAVRHALEAVYSGAGLGEAMAFLEQLDDRGQQVLPKRMEWWGSDCLDCGNATPGSWTCDECNSDARTAALFLPRSQEDEK